MNKSQLSAQDIAAIIQSVKVYKLSHKEAALKHRVRPRLVQSLVKASEKDKKFFERLIEIESKRKYRVRKVIEVS